MKLSTLLLAALLPLTAAAAPSDSVYLEELTSAEVAARIAAARTVALVPIGGTEQNGDNIVLGKHNVRAQVIAGDIARMLGHTVVAPVIAYVPEGSIDPPTGHMRGAGTISIPSDVFEKTLEAAARSLLKHGFVAVVLLGDHGGYQASLHRVAERMNRSFKRNAVLVPREYYREMEHAGMADTELSLAVDPKLVRQPGAARVESGRTARAGIVESTAGSLRRSLGR